MGTARMELHFSFPAFLCMEKQRKAEGQGDFEEGFQALVRAVHTACLLMAPPWTTLGKSLPIPPTLFYKGNLGQLIPASFLLILSG